MFRLLKWAFRLVFVCFFVISISLNVASFVGGAIWATASTAWGAATGKQSYFHSQQDELARAVSEADDLRGVNRKTKADLAQVTDALEGERKISRRARTELASARKQINESDLLEKAMRREALDPLSKPVVFKGKVTQLKDAVSQTSNRISSRATKSALRGMGSMSGEAIPFWGTAVIVSVTSLELYDLCQTIKDMNALKIAFNPELESSEDEATVCSMRVPTREELWASTKAAPGAAWAAAREFTPTLEEIKSWELPDIDAQAMWDKTKAGTATAAGWVKDSTVSAGQSAWQGTKTLGAATASKSVEIGGTALEGTKSGLGALATGTRNLLFGDEEASD